MARRGIPARGNKAPHRNHVRTTSGGLIMKTQKELSAKSEADLNKELGELYKTHFSLRMQKATQQLTNTSQLGNVRRDIARVKTMLAQKATSK